MRLIRESYKLSYASRIGQFITYLGDNRSMEIKFTQTLSKALKDKNISQIAREIDMPRNMLHDWAKAKRVPSLSNIDFIKRLADYLGLSLDELLIGKEERKIISSVSFSDEGREYRLIIERTK